MHASGSSSQEQGLTAFLEELRQYEHRRTPDGATALERLDRCLVRLQELVLFLEPTDPLLLWPGSQGPGDILARMMVMTQVLGWGMWATGSGEPVEVPLSTFLSLRETWAAKCAELAPEEILDMVRAEVTNSMEYLCMADSEQMARAAQLGEARLNPAEIGEQLLCAHLELSVDELAHALHVEPSPAKIVRYAW